MPAELVLPIGTVVGFLLVLARVTGVILFVPIPGLQAVPDAPRVVLALGLSIILIPEWPKVSVDPLALGPLIAMVAMEFTSGLLIGVCVSFLLEGVQMATQMIGLQAGYSFASTVDPSTQADSTVLQMTSQLFAGVIFLTLGLHREVIRVLAYSLAPPAGTVRPGNFAVMGAVVRLGSEIFVAGLRLALPVLALLILMDVSFAIFGKVHSQFQLMSLSFAAKMMAGIGILATTLGLFPALCQRVAGETLPLLARLLGG